MFSGDSNRRSNCRAIQLKSYLLRKTKRLFPKFRDARWIDTKKALQTALETKHTKRNEKHTESGLLTIDTCYLFFGECVVRLGGGWEGKTNLSVA